MKGQGPNILPTNIDDQERVQDDDSDRDDEDIGLVNDGFNWLQGALDMYITSVQMNSPGVLKCPEDKAQGLHNV